MRPAQSFIVAASIAAMLLAPAAASALTVDEVVSLARAGVTDAIILALIDRDKTIFALEPDQLVTLKQQGVSDAVILAMLKSGREEADRAAQAESDLKTAIYLAERSAGPELLVPSGGPDTVSGPASYASSPPVSYGLPFIVGPYGAGRRARRSVAPFRPYIAAPGSSAFQPVIPPTMVPVIPPVASPAIPPVSRAQTPEPSAPSRRR